MAAPALLAAISRGSMVMGAGSQASGMYPPLQNLITQQAFNSWPNSIPGISDAVTLRRFGVLDDQSYYQICRENGFDAAYAKQYLESSQSLLTATDYVNLKRRKLVDTTLMNERLKMLGFKEGEYGLVEKATEYLAGPSDLVRFAVRDVYTDAKVANYKLDEGFPSKFAEECEKLGISTDLAHKFWQAHWELPSLTQGFEMLHREVISREQLMDLMESQDVMPGWREPLMKISYRTLTRVDVRRMFKLGVLDKAGVAKAYRDEGYTAEDADNLAEFVERDVAADTEGLTIAGIVKAYVNGLNTATETVSLLQKKGYKPDIINFYMEQAEYDKLLDKLKAVTADLKQQYILGLVTEEIVRNTLKGMGAPDNYIELELSKMISGQASRAKIPSKADWERWFNKDIIGEKEYFDGLVSLGYAPAYAQRYLEEELKDRDEPKRQFMSDAIYVRWLKGGIMTLSQFIQTMEEKGKSQLDIDLLVRESGASE